MSLRSRVRCLAGLFGGVLGCLAATAPAQQHDPSVVRFADLTWDASFFVPGGAWDPSVPTPEAFLGFPVGRRPLRYDEMRRYLEALAAASPRLALRTHGHTHEGRPLLHVAAGTPERIAALESVRQAMARFADPRTGGGDDPPEDLPLVAWFGYAIHGDELSGCDAAVQLAYQLAAGRDSVTLGILDRVLVLVDPLQNPDGRERYLAQVQSFEGRVPNPDAQSLQHRGFWPWGRANHYLFDLNRDWFRLVHPESRGRVGALVAWNPQLVIDGHEMGWNDTYLFSPPREPFNPHLPPEERTWWEVFARDQAAAFDRRGWSFYTREWNEEFFPGYGSSWASYRGAVGILYEQAGTDGSVVRQTDGSYLTFREAVLHQFASTWANLQTAAAHRRALLRSFRAGHRHAIEAGRTGGVRAWVLDGRRHPRRARRLVDLLVHQGIEVQRAEQPFQVRDAHDPWDRVERRLELPAGTWVVRLDQPAAPLARNLLDTHVAMPDSFLREERDYLERDAGSRLYEVTTWTLPLSWDIDAWWTPRLPEGRFAAVRATDTAAPPPEGAAGAAHPTYGWILDGGDDAFAPALARLLEAGWRARVALDDFQVAGRRFPRGSAVLRVRSNADGLDDAVRRIAQATGARVWPTDSGRAEDGPDLGGSRFPALATPRIAVLTGSPLSFVSYGSIWHLIDVDLGIRMSSLDVQQLASVELETYNVLVMPDAFGGAGAYARALGETGARKIESWVEGGGTLIAVGAATAFVADSSRTWSKVRRRAQVLERFAPPEARLPLPETARMEARGDTPTAAAPARDMVWPLWSRAVRDLLRATRPRGVQVALQPGPDGGGAAPAVDEKKVPLEQLERGDAWLRRFHPQGALLQVDLDERHWLTAGMPARVAALLSHDRAYIAEHPVHVVGRFADRRHLHRSGLLWPEAAARVARTAYLTQERHGKGQVILFSGDPTYRRTTPGLERLLQNALLVGPGVGVERAAPW